MKLKKPVSIAADKFKSQAWDELVAGRTFSPSDIPALRLLCQWLKIAEQATTELEQFGDTTAYTDDSGDLKQFPQIATLKTASGEIRQLQKQLGIHDAELEPVKEVTHEQSVFSVITGRRAQRRANATA